MTQNHRNNFSLQVDPILNFPPNRQMMYRPLQFDYWPHRCSQNTGKGLAACSQVNKDKRLFDKLEREPCFPYYFASSAECVSSRPSTHPEVMSINTYSGFKIALRRRPSHAKDRPQFSMLQSITFNMDSHPDLPNFRFPWHLISENSVSKHLLRITLRPKWIQLRRQNIKHKTSTGLLNRTTRDRNKKLLVPFLLE